MKDMSLVDFCTIGGFVLALGLLLYRLYKVEKQVEALSKDNNGLKNDCEDFKHILKQVRYSYDRNIEWEQQKLRSAEERASSYKKTLIDMITTMDALGKEEPNRVAGSD